MVIDIVARSKADEALEAAGASGAAAAAAEEAASAAQASASEANAKADVAGECAEQAEIAARNAQEKADSISFDVTVNRELADRVPQANYNGAYVFDASTTRSEGASAGSGYSAAMFNGSNPSFTPTVDIWLRIDKSIKQDGALFRPTDRPAILSLTGNVDSGIKYSWGWYHTSNNESKFFIAGNGGGWDGDPSNILSEANAIDIIKDGGVYKMSFSVDFNGVSIAIDDKVILSYASTDVSRAFSAGDYFIFYPKCTGITIFRTTCKMANATIHDYSGVNAMNNWSFGGNIGETSGLQTGWNKSEIPITLNLPGKVFAIKTPTRMTELENDGYFVQDEDYNHTDRNYTAEDKQKLAEIEPRAQVNTITSVNGKVGDVALNSGDVEADLRGASAIVWDGLMTILKDGYCTVEAYNSLSSGYGQVRNQTLMFWDYTGTTPFIFRADFAISKYAAGSSLFTIQVPSTSAPLSVGYGKYEDKHGLMLWPGTYGANEIPSSNPIDYIELPIDNSAHTLEVSVNSVEVVAVLDGYWTLRCSVSGSGQMSLYLFPKYADVSVFHTKLTGYGRTLLDGKGKNSIGYQSETLSDVWDAFGNYSAHNGILGS